MARLSSRGRGLAASFVVVVAGPACKKTPVVDPDPEPPPGRSSSHVYENGRGECTLSPIVHCPKGATCNPPAPDVIDCPPDKRDAAAPPGIARRPQGKEDWLRVKPHLYVASNNRCSYSVERFCAPPPKPYECTSWHQSIDVPCTSVDGDAGGPNKTIKTEAFVWKDVLGVCHEIPALTCQPGDCPVPDGAVVPCP